ncbi:MAG: dicarboxylate/amino acid:cation symporter [Deltaproteobacteria bacterium]|nr:dicarboxylate/amino acid:cation symporter [Deltaproteobacteria bacterium]MBW2383072.1 dicarboxylate/amino acid:cation symporter [Deltaproteobacteria bacterium]MBW2696507.1 dicarboxylate/amino acid:cation symporter [Deltaproteobacteria bacterium]
MAAGLATGVLLNLLLRADTVAGGPVEQLIRTGIVDGVFYVGGAVFMASLKLLVVPLVFVSLVCGTASLDDISRLGRIGGKTLGLYLLTTAIAITLALLAASIVRPGAGLDLPADLSFATKQAPGFADTLVNIFPSNPVRAMSEGNMLQVIVFAALFGFAMTLSGAPGRRLLEFFQDANAVVLRLVTVLMEVAPYGVFCLLAKIFALQGLSAIIQMFGYFCVVLGVLLVHGMLTYPALLRTLSGLDPLTFARKMRAPISFAFSTASSNATLPVTLETVEDRLGVNNKVASFTIPLGATINMDGTAIMQGVATGFIAQAYGIDLTLVDYLMVVLTATLASIGTAGVPGVGLIMLAMVLKQVNLPVEGIGLIIGVDRLLDMVRTAVNITGDAAVTCIVAKSEGELSQEIFELD